jgi:hypothetical protein
MSLCRANSIATRGCTFMVDNRVMKVVLNA